MPPTLVPPSHGAHLVGQPFTLSNLSVPVNALLSCNCACVHGGVPTNIPIIGSAPAECPSCRTIYVVGFNPQNGSILIAMTKPEPERMPS